MSKNQTALESFNAGQKSVLDQRNDAIAECERWKAEAMAYRAALDAKVLVCSEAASDSMVVKHNDAIAEARAKNEVKS